MHKPSRTVLISSFTYGGISELHEICNLPLFMDSLPPLDATGILLNTMFQAGVDLFEIPGFDNSIRVDSIFWLKRIQFFHEDEYDSISRPVQNLFKIYLPDDYLRNDKYSPIWSWETFLTDLLYCLKRNTVMACGEMPDIANIEGFLPPEICVPISNLCEYITTEQLSVPIPRSSIPWSQIKRFRSIIESDAFAKYIDAHKGFESSRSSLRDTISRVTDRSLILQYNYPALLKIRDIAIGVFPASAKLLSAVFQQIPGKLAEELATRIFSWLSADRHVVIYETRPILMRLLIDRLLKASKNEKNEEPNKSNSADEKKRAAD